jgi:hypothetical protein
MMRWSMGSVVVLRALQKGRRLKNRLKALGTQEAQHWYLLIVRIIALVAAGYLFWRFRSVFRKKNTSCDSGTCGSASGRAKTDCGGSRQLATQNSKNITGETRNY